MKPFSLVVSTLTNFKLIVLAAWYFHSFTLSILDTLRLIVVFYYPDAGHDRDTLVIGHRSTNSTSLLFDLASSIEINLYKEPLCKKCLHPLRDHDHVIAKKKEIVEIKQCTVGICYCTISQVLKR